MNNPSPIKIAKMELQGLTMLYNTMVQECWSKCIPNTKEVSRFFGERTRVRTQTNPLFTQYIQAELNVGEQSCTDRCISKYLEVRTPNSLFLSLSLSLLDDNRSSDDKT